MARDENLESGRKLAACAASINPVPGGGCGDEMLQVNEVMHNRLYKACRHT